MDTWEGDLGGMGRGLDGGMVDENGEAKNACVFVLVGGEGGRRAAVDDISEKEEAREEVGLRWERGEEVDEEVNSGRVLAAGDQCSATIVGLRKWDSSVDIRAGECSLY